MPPAVTFLFPTIIYTHLWLWHYKSRENATIRCWT